MLDVVVDGNLNEWGPDSGQPIDQADRAEHRASGAEDKEKEKGS